MCRVLCLEEKNDEHILSDEPLKNVQNALPRQGAHHVPGQEVLLSLPTNLYIKSYYLFKKTMEKLKYTECTLSSQKLINS